MAPPLSPRQVVMKIAFLTSSREPQLLLVLELHSETAEEEDQEALPFSAAQVSVPPLNSLTGVFVLPVLTCCEGTQGLCPSL